MPSNWELSLPDLLDTFYEHTHSHSNIIFGIGQLFVAVFFFIIFQTWYLTHFNTWHCLRKGKNGKIHCNLVSVHLNIHFLCGSSGGQTSPCWSFIPLAHGSFKGKNIIFLFVCSDYGGQVGRPAELPWNRAVGTQFRGIYIMSGSLSGAFKDLKCLHEQNIQMERPYFSSYKGVWSPDVFSSDVHPTFSLFYQTVRVILAALPTDEGLSTGLLWFYLFPEHFLRIGVSKGEKWLCVVSDDLVFWVKNWTMPLIEDSTFFSHVHPPNPHG